MGAPKKEDASIDVKTFHQIVSNMFGKHGSYLVIVDDQKSEEMFMASSFKKPEAILLLTELLRQLKDGEAFEQTVKV